MVGTAGRAASRLAVVTAGTRSLPDCTSGRAETMMSIIIWVRPANKSTKTAPEPL